MLAGWLGYKTIGRGYAATIVGLTVALTNTCDGGSPNGCVVLWRHACVSLVEALVRSIYSMPSTAMRSCSACLATDQ